MPKNLNFYFGTVVFFLGVLMAAVGVANVIAQRLDFMVLVALITGLVLIAIGYVVSKGKSTRDGMSKQKQNVRSTRLQALHS